MVVISKPKLEGYYNKTMIISTDCIYPFQRDITILKDIPLQAIADDERYYCYRFTTSKHYIENIFYSREACAGSCDGYYLGSCYCINRLQRVTWLVGIQFGFEEYEDIECKPYHSISLTKKLISKEIIEKEGYSSNGTSLLPEIEDHITEEISGKSITFLVWFKASKGKEDENLHLSLASISSATFDDSTNLSIFSMNDETEDAEETEENELNENDNDENDNDENDYSTTTSVSGLKRKDLE